jgi:hypothetical protein
MSITLQPGEFSLSQLRAIYESQPVLTLQRSLSATYSTKP